MDDVFAIQDEISLAIVDKLKVKLLKSKRAALTKRYTDNIEAYNLYLKGRFHWNKRSIAELKKAKDLFEKVIKIDPNYALAYTGLADCYSIFIHFAVMLPKDGFPKAKEMALKALQIDNTLAEAHTSLAYVMVHFEWDFKEAENEYKKAIELNPNYATAHQWYGIYLMYVGNLDEAVYETKKAQELDPLSPILKNAYGWVLVTARRYEEAKEVCNQLINDDPSFRPIHSILGYLYEETKMYDNAIKEYLLAQDGSGIINGEDIEALRKSYRISGWDGACRKIIDIFKQKPHAQISAEIALNYFRLGEIDLAFEWCEKAYNEKDAGLLWIIHNQNLDCVRSDPRYLNLMKKIGLE
jgi:Tfp pilus assembly protein PilF